MNKKAEWFEKGRQSVLRKNKSGCCCLMDENDNIVSLCEAHKNYIQNRPTVTEEFVEKWQRKILAQLWWMEHFKSSFTIKDYLKMMLREAGVEVEP